MSDWYRDEWRSARDAAPERDERPDHDEYCDGDGDGLCRECARRIA